MKFCFNLIDIGIGRGKGKGRINHDGSSFGVLLVGVVRVNCCAASTTDDEGGSICSKVESLSMKY
jgi:hypothetical protein